MGLSTIIIITTLATSCLATRDAPMRRASMQLKQLFGRQISTHFCQTVETTGGIPPNICELSCGPGYEQCIRYPTCYNPGKGDQCCSNGAYCPSGTYCTDIGCCDEGLSLAECGASYTVSTLAAAPSATLSSKSTIISATLTDSTRTSSNVAITSVISASSSTVLSGPLSSSLLSPTSTSSVPPTHPTTPQLQSPTGATGSNASVTSLGTHPSNVTASIPAVQTVNAGERMMAQGTLLSILGALLFIF